jgi:hypothetical protein
MDNVGVSSQIVEDAAGIVLKSRRYSNTTSNRPSLIDLLDHVLFTRELTIFLDAVSIILIRYKAGFVRVAVFANVNGRAFFAIVMTSGSVDRTSLISNVLLVDEFESIECGTTVATIISSIARDNDLRRNVDIRPCSLSCNLNSVRKR